MSQEERCLSCILKDELKRIHQVDGRAQKAKRYEAMPGHTDSLFPCTPYSRVLTLITLILVSFFKPRSSKTAETNSVLFLLCFQWHVVVAKQIFVRWMNERANEQMKEKLNQKQFCMLDARGKRKHSARR